MRRNLDTGLFHAMRLFVRVADARSMTAAAAQSSLTTAQISRMITELERRLETKLIQRNSRNLTLTSAGENYLLKCREVLDLVAEAEGEAAGSAEQPVGNLRIICLSGFGGRYVVPLIPEYLKRYPNAQVEYLTQQRIPDLLGEGIDVGMFVARELRSSSLIAKRVGTIHAHMCAKSGLFETIRRTSPTGRLGSSQVSSPRERDVLSTVGPNRRPIQLHTTHRRSSSFRYPRGACGCGHARTGNRAGSFVRDY